MYFQTAELNNATLTCLTCITIHIRFQMFPHCDFIIKTCGNTVIKSSDGNKTLSSAVLQVQLKRTSLHFISTLQNAVILFSVNLSKMLESFTSLNSMLSNLSTIYKMKIQIHIPEHLRSVFQHCGLADE